MLLFTSIAMCGHRTRAKSKFCIRHHAPSLLTIFVVFAQVSPGDLSASVGDHLSQPAPPVLVLAATTASFSSNSNASSCTEPSSLIPVLLHACQLFSGRKRISLMFPPYSFFIRPRYTWGPIYGSRVSLTEFGTC